MKHSGGMGAMWVRVEIDDSERRVTLNVERLDSALVCDLVPRVLPRDHQVTAFRDVGTGWVPEQPPYALRLHFDERYYQAEVARVEEDRFTVAVDSGAGPPSAGVRQSGARQPARSRPQGGGDGGCG